MSIQTVTTILTQLAMTQEQLDVAVAFARACDAHLQVLAMGVDLDHPSLGFGAIDAVPLSVGLEDVAAQAAALAKIATTRLEKEDIRWDVVPITTITSGMSFDIIRHIRFSDLVIQVRPAEGLTAEAKRISETVLFHADTPLLVMPTGYAVKAPADKIMVAWDESAAALRAVRLGLPFLQQATRVYAALVDPSMDAPDRSDPGGAFAHFLARQGVKCDVGVMVRTESSIAETLGQRAQEIGCDMIVMGAYGHSRLREALFGGTTRMMLEKARLPILFAH
jgi:nucleotide-binding universal stress UspA family protein